MASFQLIRRLGSGYFGEVWLAHDAGLDHPYALKLIPPDKVINPKNFYQEAQTIKAVEHPNVIHVYETGDMDDGKVYIKMEYLKNGSLEDEASGAHLALTRVKKLMVDILRGLEYAHSKSIVHRDIKPANILIGNSKEGKLSDFGLSLPDLSKIDISTLKKYQYWMHLAPEVDKLADYNFLSDIYSCGMTLYRLVNGDTFLPTVVPKDLREQIKAGKFPNRNNYREFIPISLKKIINKALNLNPADRFKSAEAMRHALEQTPLGINWNETLLTNGMRWVTSHDHETIEVIRIKNKKGAWDVETKKGKNLSELRKINRLCVEGANLTQATQHTKRVLQDFVIGKEK
jgi:serine/threonine protein kinase